MPKRSSKRPETDPNRIAFLTVQKATGSKPPAPEPIVPAKNPHAVALGKLGGSKGGKARKEALSSKRRKTIARKAAKTRWAKKTRLQQDAQGRHSVRDRQTQRQAR